MATQPSITVVSTDYDRLERLLASLPDAATPGKGDLARELRRADIVEPDAVTEPLVRMHSTVRFTVDASKDSFRMKLVYPHETGAGTISVLAPVGSALLGLRVGDEISWPKPGGGELRVRIAEIA